MEIRDSYFTVEKMGPCMNLYIMPDCHMGSPAFLQKEYDRLAEIIKNDRYAFLIFQGDLLDSNRPSTREMKKVAYANRKEEHVQEDFRNQFWIEQKIIPKLKEIITKDNCIGMLDGDHFIKLENGMSSTQIICSKLNIPYLGDGQAIVKLHFIFKKSPGHCSVLNLHIQHGIGGGGRSGNNVNKLEDTANIWEGIDIFARGHSHKGFIYPISKYAISERSNNLIQRDIWLVNTPSFRTGIVMGMTDYAEQRNYAATAHKFPVLHISTDFRSLGRNFNINVTGELV